MRPAPEYDVFQKLVASLAEAADCCKQIARIRNDYRWNLIVELLENTRDKCYHLTHKASRGR